jgi:methylmalonyl-CoA mutase N-terminal domain/subunit
VDRSETVVVGVNRFQSEDGRTIPIQRIDEDLERKQVERLQALRARRDKKVWESALKAVEDTARGGDNLMPRIITAVEACCTIGEISDALRRVFGEYQETIVV